MKKILIGSGLVIAGFAGGLAYGVYCCKKGFEEALEEDRADRQRRRLSKPYGYREHWEHITDEDRESM